MSSTNIGVFTISTVFAALALSLSSTPTANYKPVTDRRLRPGAATWDVTLSARKVVPCVRWPTTGILLRTVYSQAQGCVCTAFQLGGDVEQPWLMSKYDVIHKTGITLRRQRKTESRP